MYNRYGMVESLDRRFMSVVTLDVGTGTAYQMALPFNQLVQTDAIISPQTHPILRLIFHETQFSPNVVLLFMICVPQPLVEY